MSNQQKIRIVSWNCCKGDFAKIDAIFNKYHPDIAVIQEMKRPEKDKDNQCVWVLNRLTKELGTGVISSNDWRLEFCTGYPDTPEVFVPVKISNKTTSFNLLGVWTQKAGKYVESFESVLDNFQDFLQPSRSIIVGDFNSNPKWDEKHKKFSHSMLNKTLEKKFGLVSAYHTRNNSVIPGKESPDESTFFMYGHRDKPYHIDYCYVPKTWTIDCARIGSYDEWCNKEKVNSDQKSDHLPLIVDLKVTNANEKSETIIRKPGQDRFCAEIEVVPKE